MRLKQSRLMMNIEQEDAGQRLDHLLQRLFRKIPKARLYRAIRKGEVRVNGGRVKAMYRLKCGDELRIPPPFEHEVSQRNMANSSKINDCKLWNFEGAIVFENNDLICLNKPSGMAVHAGSGIKMGVIEFVRAQREGYFELAHRLDRATSGCLIIAKRQSVLRALSKLFHDRDVKKVYLALVMGEVESKRFVIDLPLKKIHSKQNEHRSIVDHEHGRKAKTKVKLQQSHQGESLLMLYPSTGRMHQLRAHCAAVGHPIVGDTKYGGDKSSHDRLCLHAESIAFTLANHAFQFSAPCDFISDSR